jgi:hypothetical protein
MDLGIIEIKILTTLVTQNKATIANQREARALNPMMLEKLPVELDGHK